MREIKFRVWVCNPTDPKTGYYADSLLFDNRRWYIDGDGRWDTCELEEKGFYIEQYTGIQDAEGVDIYEGDIVRYWLDAVQEWSPYYTVTFGYVELGTGTGMYGYGWASGDWFLYETCTVCGNKHQHSHLLEEP